MRKVRVLKELPIYPVGRKLKIENDSLLGLDVNFLIRDGWLEEVVEEKSLADKMKEANFNKIIDYDLLAKIAMQHAYEVAQKAREHHYKCGCCDLVLKALKQEAELNKTKES